MRRENGIDQREPVEPWKERESKPEDGRGSEYIEVGQPPASLMEYVYEMHSTHNNTLEGQANTVTVVFLRKQPSGHQLNATGRPLKQSAASRRPQMASTCQLSHIQCTTAMDG